mgnify:CR=1 FL=1
MKIIPSKNLVENALLHIKTIEPTKALELIDKKLCNLIDIRDIRELDNEGRIEEAKHIPRGMLEFWLDPQSSYFKENKLNLNKKIVLFCALGMRSALATKSLIDMGYTNAAHVNGGFDTLKQSGLEIVVKKKK